MKIDILTKGIEELYNQLTKKQKKEFFNNYGGDCLTDFTKAMLGSLQELIPDVNLYEQY